MKKGFLFLILFLLIVGGIYLFNKNLKDLNLSQKFSSKNQINKTNITSKVDQENESNIKEVSQGLSLEINQPKDNSVVNSSTITVSGKTSIAGAEVFVNEKELKADSQGNFSTSLNLDEGENVITIVASDSQGNNAEKELTVTLETVE